MKTMTVGVPIVLHVSRVLGGTVPVIIPISLENMTTMSMEEVPIGTITTDIVHRLLIFKCVLNMLVDPLINILWVHTLRCL